VFSFFRIALRPGGVLDLPSFLDFLYFLPDPFFGFFPDPGFVILELFRLDLDLFLQALGFLLGLVRGLGLLLRAFLGFFPGLLGSLSVLLRLFCVERRGLLL